MTPTVQHCCCGLDLKTGTIIIGVLGILGSISSISKDVLEASGIEVNTSDEAISNEDTSDEESDEMFEKAWRVICIISALFSVVELILSIILVYGANNENPRLVKPWVYFSTVCLVIMVIVSAICIIVVFVYGEPVQGVVYLVVVNICAAITTYFIIVVNSFHLRLIGTLMMPVKV